MIGIYVSKTIGAYLSLGYMTDSCAKFACFRSVKKRKNRDNQNDRQRNRQRPDVEENESDHENDEAHLLQKLPVNEEISVNEYVAVANDDAWYPGWQSKSKRMMWL